MSQLPENISPELILAFLKNEAGMDDVAIVQSWIDESHENKRQFEQFKVVWEETGLLIPTPVDVDIDLAWQKMSLKIDKYEEKSHDLFTDKGRVVPFRRYMLRVAAVLIPLIVITGLILLLTPKQDFITRETTALTLSDTLSDGSVVALNKLSKISYPQKFEGKTREVEMEGEIFFKVNPDSVKPFIIHAGETMIKVLGTSFNVKAFADSSLVEVSVNTGRVLFSGPGNESNITDTLILVAGQTGIYNNLTKKIRRVELPVKPELQQEDKIIIFNRSSLLQVANDLKKYYGVTVELKDRGLANTHYSATFKNYSIDSILQVISGTLDLKVTRQDAKYILEANE